MANLCENALDLSGDKNKLIILLENAISNNYFFNSVIKMPDELLAYSDDPEEIARRISLYNHTGWHEWRLANWGTKWDVETVDIYGVEETLDNLKNSTEAREVVSLSFDTPWRPPIEFYAALEKLGFSVDAYYYEPGCRFYGNYAEGCDNCFDYNSVTQIPEEYVEMFGIELTDDDEESE